MMVRVISWIVFGFRSQDGNVGLAGLDVLGNVFHGLTPVAI
jgi:hypothetical protein